ncbi:hypothetical protein NECAME_07548 [Necator americanus]|uniref:Uncharacterized protein n=1 Tax=Necator americanus TaxID=51031 RepID=W2TQ29_NECAM|nr:hypothetical protein NECAME_07548 [Necator americanus]ETN83132.1 hypothetical protein NECAME_07548 [Necator americanus]
MRLVRLEASDAFITSATQKFYGRTILYYTSEKGSDLVAQLFKFQSEELTGNHIRHQAISFA